jgi:HKD family nuclease
MLISNQTSSNHWDELKELFKNADKAIITSPFLMADLAAFLDEIFTDQINELVLFTCLTNKKRDASKVAHSVSTIYEYAENRTDFKLTVLSVNKLHGKAYLAYNKNTCFGGIVTSANLTNNGLKSNKEWGIKIEKKSTLENLERTIHSLQYDKLTKEAIEKVIDRINSIPGSDNDYEDEIIDLSEIFNFELPYNFINHQIWLKPVGHSEDHIQIGHSFAELNPRLHFSKRRPSSVKMDDILITYGVGVQSILSIYKVDSNPLFITEEDIENGYDERWPWYVFGENLTPNFGSEWWEHGITLKDLRNEFLSQNPNKPLTYVGGTTFGAFNFKADKLHLDQEFGEWLMNKVWAIENNHSVDRSSEVEKVNWNSLDLESINNLLQRQLTQIADEFLTPDQCAEFLSEVNLIPQNESPGKYFRKILRAGLAFSEHPIKGASQHQKYSRWKICKAQT